VNSFIKARVLMGAVLLLTEKSNVRDVARKIHCSKSTVHKDMTERLPKIPYIGQRLYEKVQELFYINKEEAHIRGGEATKIKYKGTSLEKVA